MSGDPIRDRARKRRLYVAVAVLAASVLALGIQREFTPVQRTIRALRSGEPSVRLAASEALGRTVPADAPAAIPALADALGDPDGGVATAAALSLGGIGGVALRDAGARGSVRVAAEALSRAVADRRAEVRAAAAEALGQLAGGLLPGAEPPFDPGPAANALAGAMRDPDERVRSVARQALSELAHKTAIVPPKALLSALGRAESVALRREVLAALPAFGMRLRGAIPALVAALADRDPDLRYRAAGVLGGAGGSARASIPALIAVLEEPVGPRPTAPALIARPAAADFRLQARPRVEVAPDRWDPACAAARALGRIVAGARARAEAEVEVAHDHGAVAALAAALRSEHDWRRNAAAEGLFLIGKDAAAATPALIAALTESVTREDEGDGDGRRANSWAARALGRTAPGTAAEAEAIAALTRALDSTAQGTRACSAESLARFGPRAAPALPRLRALRGDPDRIVSAMARAAVTRLELEGAPMPTSPTAQ
jgi:HEAT repeat protein